MQTREKLWMAGGLAALVIGAGWLWQDRPAEPAPQRVHTATAPPPRPALPLPAHDAKAPSVPATIARNAEPLNLQVERLLATRDPQDALAAYYLVAGCTEFNTRHGLKLWDDTLGAQRDMSADERRGMTAMCGNMTERERQARLDYLALAVEGGAPGAAWIFAGEGPFGDRSALQTRPGDPLVQEWKARAVTQLTQAAEAGDLATLTVWGIQKLYGSDLADKDAVLGYGYLLAVSFIEADRSGPDSAGARAYRDGHDVMNAFGAGLTSEQRAAAIAAARSIANKVKGRR